MTTGASGDLLHTPQLSQLSQPFRCLSFSVCPVNPLIFGELGEISRIHLLIHVKRSVVQMALLQTSLIWIVYAVVIAILLAVASVFIYVYQTPRDRSPSVTLTCIIAITSLLATVLLLPVDVALVSSTTSSKLGRRKDWATQDEVDKITYSLTIIYYLLYSLDALLCLLVLPFTYFWYEEYDEVAAEAGEQTVGQRFWGALKYTLSFIAIVVILFLVGFFAPVSKDKSNLDLDYFKRLLTENRKSTHCILTLAFHSRY
jgi:LMBR1 domain-containing protein 1